MGGVFNAVADIATAMGGMLLLLIIIFAFTMIVKVLYAQRDEEYAHNFIGEKLHGTNLSDKDWIAADKAFDEHKKAVSIKRKYGFE